MTSATDAPQGAGPLPFPSPGPYTCRESKSRYIAAKYAPLLRGAVLDVGCDAAQLRQFVGDPSLYIGVDLSDDADVALDLDREDLPFPDASFDTVVCCDVLEHLERIHAVFDEVCRVASGHVIVSLPNAIKAMLLGLFEGSNGAMKWYGLPLEPQKDRHRWFFGYEDAVRFVRRRGALAGFEPVQIDPESDGGYYWLNGAGRDVLDHPNVRLGTMWAVLRRTEAAR